MSWQEEQLAKEQAAGIEAGRQNLRRRMEQTAGADIQPETLSAYMREAGIEKPKDPWVHRASGMRCKTCMWFVPKQASSPVTPGSYDLGRCRRHAPTMNGYPTVFVNDWCGDHKLDENKFAAHGY
jgi:Pyruvate/2-oxoacid:ferredoxin oxidoreductase delta subunit